MSNNAHQNNMKTFALGSKEADSLISGFIAKPEALDEKGVKFTFTDGECKEYLINVKPDVDPNLKIEVFPLFVNSNKPLTERRPWSFQKVKLESLAEFLTKLNSKQPTTKTLMMFK